MSECKKYIAQTVRLLRQLSIAEEALAMCKTFDKRRGDVTLLLERMGKALEAIHEIDRQETKWRKT